MRKSVLSTGKVNIGQGKGCILEKYEHTQYRLYAYKRNK